MESSGVSSVAEVVRYLTADVVPIAGIRGGEGRDVTGVLIHDPLDLSSEWANKIVVCPGTGPAAGDFESILQRAQQSNAAALAIKTRGTSLEALRSRARAHSVTLLAVQDDADWSLLTALMRSAILGAAADSVTGIPLGDIYNLANIVASAADGATSIVDPMGRILGYSTLPDQPIDDLRRTTTLSLQEVTPPSQDPDFKAVFSSKAAIRVPPGPGELPRCAVAVRAGGELLGSIWTIEPQPPKPERVLEALNKFAPLAGLHLLHARAGADFGERRSGDLIRTLLEGSSHAPFAAAQLGLDVSKGMAVAIFSVDQPDRGNLDTVREMQRLLHLVTMLCNLQFATSQCALIDSRVHALFPVTGQHPRTSHRRIAQDVGQYARSFTSHRVLAGVGAASTSLEGLSRSRDQARQLLDHVTALHARSANVPTTALFEDYRAALGMQAVGAFIRDNMLDDNEELEHISEHDRKHGTEYLLTLKAYLNSKESVAATAAALHIHDNTARYRIKRLVEQFGVDLADPESVLWLHLRIHAFTRPGSLH